MTFSLTLPTLLFKLPNSLWRQSRENLNLKKFAFFSNTVRRIGCFKDTARRAIPGVEGRGPLLTGYYRRRSGALKKCALFTLMKGFKVFGVQHQGWCATGPRAHVTYRKYGPSTRCRNGKGGPLANDVYRVYGKTLFHLVSLQFFMKRQYFEGFLFNVVQNSIR